MPMFPIACSDVEKGVSLRGLRGRARPGRGILSNA